MFFCALFVPFAARCCRKLLGQIGADKTIWSPNNGVGVDYFYANAPYGKAYTMPETHPEWYLRWATSQKSPGDPARALERPIMPSQKGRAVYVLCIGDEKLRDPHTGLPAATNSDPISGPDPFCEEAGFGPGARCCKRG